MVYQVRPFQHRHVKMCLTDWLQFDEMWNGRVVAEQVDWSRSKDLFRGLNFPASDIPAQPRELYKVTPFMTFGDTSHCSQSTSPPRSTASDFFTTVISPPPECVVARSRKSTIL